MLYETLFVDSLHKKYLNKVKPLILAFNYILEKKISLHKWPED